MIIVELPVHFDDSVFLFLFLPAFLTLFYGVVALDGVHPRLGGWGSKAAATVFLGGSVWLIVRTPVGLLLLASAFLTLTLAAIAEETRRAHEFAAKLALAVSMTATVTMFVIARSMVDGSMFALAGVAVIACHELAFILDVHAGRATTRNPLTAWVYLVQFPVLPAGPIVRFHEIDKRCRNLIETIALGAFTYGMRRLITGLVKVIWIAETLSDPVDAIYKLPPASLTIDAAWFAAICFALQLYFLFSGYADMAIGLGRMVGLRYPENFHRPYLADSVREFWSRWHVTSITWLRDYFGFPIAGRDAPTLRLVPSIITGFLLLGFWYGGGWTVFVWAMYSSAFLAVEALGLGTRVSRWPTMLRHLYVLFVITVGWVILRADSLATAGSMLSAMAGAKGVGTLTIGRYFTWPLWSALVLAIIGAGPLIPWLSRWRVTVDAVTASVAMMMASLSVFIWRIFVPTRHDAPKKT